MSNKYFNNQMHQYGIIGHVIKCFCPQYIKRPFYTIYCTPWWWAAKRVGVCGLYNIIVMRHHYVHLLAEFTLI